MRDKVEFRIIGLKEKWNFKEVHIPVLKSNAHIIILEVVLPVIEELEGKNLINGFHFIFHDDLDLRLSSVNWRSSKKAIQKILKEYDLPDTLEDWGPLPPRMYGGKWGEILCYNNLEFNSRLILGLLQARDCAESAITRDQLYMLLYSQWNHYLFFQYGINDEEIGILFRNSLRRLSNRIDEMEVRQSIDSWDSVMETLAYMKQTVRDYRKEFLKRKGWKKLLLWGWR